ncbi:MAG: copper resistance protein CopC [Anaerolineae bacterium]|nr:copper resistance protein CopC [Anaerolineae bacterium]
MCSLKTFRLASLGLIAVAALLITVIPAHAQAAIVAAAPGPGQSVSTAPAEVRLTFDHPLLDQGTSLSVTNEAWDRVDNQDSHIDPNNRFDLVVTLPELSEGPYIVTYVVASVGSSTTLAGDYQFTIDFPDPVVRMVVPHGEQVFEPGPIPLEFQTQFVDFSADNTRIRIYVDGALYTELQGSMGQISYLTPGVHELRSVLTQFERQELPETSSTMYIVVAHPDPELAGREAAAAAPADPGLQFTLLQWAGVILTTLALLGAGWWLGRAGKAIRNT